MSEGWKKIAVTDPEGWREVHAVGEDGRISRYVETAEVDADGQAVFQFIGFLDIE
jgi:hypothetical protein